MKKQNITKALLHCAESVGVVEALHQFYGTDIRVKIYYSEAACRQDVDELQLSVRSHNALKRAGLFTVEQIVDAITDGSMERIRNLGRKSVSEIKTVLLQLGYDRLTAKEREQFFAYVAENNEILPEVMRLQG